MKKKILSIMMVAALASTGAAPVMAEDTITVPGTVLYEQDFEGDVEAEMLASIGGKNFAFTVVDDHGNKALKMGGSSAYGYNKFGPEYDNAIVKADVKQIAADGSKAAYFGIGLRAARQGGGAYFSNMATYYDVFTVNEETNAYDAAGVQTRDRIGIVATAGAQYDKFTSFDAFSDQIGILNQDGIFTDSKAKASERNFNGKYYRMEAAFIGNNFTNTMKTAAGETLMSVSAEVAPISTTGKGFTQLQSHSATFLVDNIKIMSPVEISHLSATEEESVVALGESTAFKLSAGDIIIEPDVARYEYDNKAVNIDFANGTVAPLKVGTHTIKVYLDDINSDKSLSSSFTIEGKAVENKLEVVVEEPNVAVNEGTAVKAYYGNADVTNEVTFTGADYLDGMLYPAQAGLCEVTASYDGQNVIIPIAVNDDTQKLSEKVNEPIFTEDFEGDAEELNAKYSSDTEKICVTSISNATEGTTDNALYFNNIQISSLPFGPTDLVDYVLEYDFYCPTPKGDSGSFVGATLRADKYNGGYKVGYTPAVKYNSETHKVDTTLSEATKRQLTIAYGPSNDVGKWYLTGFSGSTLQGTAMQNYWYTQRATIAGGMISTELIRRSNGATMATYETPISAMDEAGVAESGSTVLSVSQNYVYIDNVKIYPINSYKDIDVSLDGKGKIAVQGVNADDSLGAVSGTVSAKAYGAASVNDLYVNPGTGIGYVAVTYEDNSGIKKYKVIQTGEIAPAGSDVEFEIISEAKIYAETGDTLAVLESEKPVYAQVDLKRMALKGNGAMLAVAIYDFETGQMVAVKTVSVDAVQRVGESFTLYTKFILPENTSGNLYAKTMVMTTGQEPVGTPSEV